MEATIPTEKLGLILRVGFYGFLVFISLVIIGGMLQFAGILISGAMGTFAAGAIANATSVRVFERKPLLAVGLNWHLGSIRNLSIGLAAGVVAAILIIGGPIAA